MIIQSDRKKIEDKIDYLDKEILRLSNEMRELLGRNKLSDSHNLMCEMLKLKGQRDVLRDVAFTIKYKGGE